MSFFDPNYDTLYGRHSNIPECCIKYWNEVFPVIFENDDQLKALNRLTAETEKRIGKSFQYRPCFDCLRTGHWHRLHKCDGKPCEDFGKKLWEELRRKEVCHG